MPKSFFSLVSFRKLLLKHSGAKYTCVPYITFDEKKFFSHKRLKGGFP